MGMVVGHRAAAQSTAQLPPLPIQCFVFCCGAMSKAPQALPEPDAATPTVDTSAAHASCLSPPPELQVSPHALEAAAKLALPLLNRCGYVLLNGLDDMTPSQMKQFMQLLAPNQFMIPFHDDYSTANLTPDQVPAHAPDVPEVRLLGRGHGNALLADVGYEWHQDGGGTAPFWTLLHCREPCKGADTLFADGQVHALVCLCLCHHGTAQHSTALHSTAQHSTAHHATPHCSTTHCNNLHNTTIYCSPLHCSKPHDSLAVAGLHGEVRTPSCWRPDSGFCALLCTTITSFLCNPQSVHHKKEPKSRAV